MRNIYALNVNDACALEIRSSVPDWFPFAPRMDAKWLRFTVMSALRNAFRN